MTLNGTPIGQYAIRIPKGASEAVNFAGLELQRYVKQSTGDVLTLSSRKLGGPEIVLSKVGGKEPTPLAGDIRFDGFAYSVIDGDLHIYAKEDRGVLYGVYNLLEKAGWRFISSESRQRGLEWGKYMLPVEVFRNEGKTFNLEICDAVDNPHFYYRDALSYPAFNEDWACKNRYNAETWGTREFGPQRGGGNGFSGRNGHTFGALISLKEFKDTHPEYFAEIDGKRILDNDPGGGADPCIWTAQICMTNEEVIPIIVKKLCKWVEETGDREKKVVSVSQNDNRLFCQCEKCRKAYEERGGLGGVLCDFVNKIAEEFEKYHPDYMVHTFIYWSTANTAIDNGRFRHNVMPQYCIKPCMSHSFDDPNCVVNVRTTKMLKKLGSLTDNLMIWGYLSPLECVMAMLPNLDNFNRYMRTLADNNVKGIYSEMAMYNYQTPALEELRSYLYGKLMWNPYMSDEEYFAHMDDFLECYYGAGWKKVREYIDYWCKTCKYYHIDNHGPRSCDDNGNIICDENGKRLRFSFFPKELTEEVCEKCLALLDEGMKLSDPCGRKRIEILKTAPLWYEIYTLGKEKYAEGGATKKLWKDKYEYLLRRMRIFSMKYTAWQGMRDVQKMYGADVNYEFLPEDWDYPGGIGTDNLFNLGTDMKI